MNSTNPYLASCVTSPVRPKGEDDVPYILVIISGFIVAFGIMSFTINIHTSKLSPNIRYMTGNIIFYDICVVITYVLHYSILDSPTWFYYRATQYSVLGQWFSVMGFVVERLIAIMSPLKYRVYFRVVYIKAFIIVEFSCYVVILVVTAFNARDPVRAARVCWVAISLHTTLSVVSLISCIKTIILFKSKRIASNIRIISRSKETISIFCILFVVLHVPIGIETIVLRCEFDPTERLNTSYLIIVNSAIDPLIYVWKFKQCRLQALKWLSWLSCFTFFKGNIDEFRKISISTIQNTEHNLSDISNRRLYSIAESTVSSISNNVRHRLSSTEDSDVPHTTRCSVTDMASINISNVDGSKMFNIADSEVLFNTTETKTSDSADKKVVSNSTENCVLNTPFKFRRHQSI